VSFKKDVRAALYFTMSDIVHEKLKNQNNKGICQKEAEKKIQQII
jgi:hypothetical protein